MFSTIGAAAANPTQIAENLPSSLVGLVSAFPGKSPERLKPAYGMAYKFVVKLDDMLGAEEDLGRWQSCAGLKMDFNPQAVRSGGDYTSLRYLAGNVTFPKVVLKRAVDPTSSDAVQKWLRAAATGWITGTPNDSPGDVTITLHDPYGEVVLTWHLVHARPSAWSGPDLDANSSKVAVEVLELVHEGFEVVVGKSQGRGSGGRAGQTQLLRLTEEAGSNRWIEFINAPERMVVDRNTERLTLDPVSPGEDKPDGSDTTLNAGHKPNMTKLILSELWLAEGGQITDVSDLVDLLVEWMNMTKEGAKNKAPVPYFLKLKWGDFEHKVWLSGLKAEYVRFSARGKPIRAKVGLTLNLEAKTTPARGNPTSGGIPGRALHTLRMDQNLPLVAREHYGNEARWRDIAEANGIDDPLRARAGHRLFLPAPSELGGRR